MVSYTLAILYTLYLYTMLSYKPIVLYDGSISMSTHRSNNPPKFQYIDLIRAAILLHLKRASTLAKLMQMVAWTSATLTRVKVYTTLRALL